MSKMDRQLNSKKDKETIYEIYRACRLCGAGAGYKMPIIQNVVDMDDTDVELKQKVRDCVQIEVHQDDKMPPLICELCVDKVNDFYEFLEMCRQTNKRTRLRLGLPPQSMPRGAPDAGECILGLTEPVYVKEDSDGEPLSKQKKLNPKVKVKREPELTVRLEKRVLTNSRTSRLNKRAPTPPRMTRHRASSKDDNVSLSRLKDKPKSLKCAPKSILKKETKNPVQNEDNSLLTPRLKRSRDKEPVKLETPKRVKIQTDTKKDTKKQSPQTRKPSPKSSPRVTATQAKSPKISPKRAPSPTRLYKCAVCGLASKTSQGYMSHMKVHFVGFTSPRLACNPCGLWFVSTEEASTHHRHHRNKSNPYTCRRCEAEFIHLSAYDEHFDNNTCMPFNEVPDVKCDVCWHLFATNKLLDEHKCQGEDHRPGGKCFKCKKSYALLKNLKKHEQSCTAKKKGELIVDPVLLGKLKPIQIRVSRCDPLLSNLRQEHYDVSNVTADFGLDRNCVYPYISSVSRLRIKSDPDELDRMVNIKDEIKDEFYIEEDYVHWDSEDSESDGEVTCSSVLNPQKKINTLANLTLKTLFSKKCLGKVPKKKRRMKQEKSMFDSLLAGTEDDVTKDINNIIDNLGDNDEFDGQSPKDGDESHKDDKDGCMDISDVKDVKGDDGKENDSDKGVDEGKVNDSDENAVNEEENDKVSIADNSPEKKDQKAQNDKLSDVIDSTNEKNDDEVSKQDVNSASENFNSVRNETEGSNNNLSSNSKDNNDELSRIDNDNNGNLNNFSFDYDDGVVFSKNDSGSKVNEILSSVGRDENQNDGPNAKNDENNHKIDYDENQDSNPVSCESESLLNDNDVCEKETIDNATSLAGQNTNIDENKSQSNEFSVDNFSQDSTSQLKMNDNSQANEDVNENDYTNAISVIVNSGKGKVATESEELEDSRLMEALDAQIGEGNDNSREKIIDNSREHINDNSREQINDNSREQQHINDNSREQINDNSREQINDNSREQQQINDNSREQINDNSREQQQINDNSREQINDNSRGQVNDNFNNEMALDELITAKNSDMDMIPEEFSFDA